ncbi:hypothetical protein AU252_09770 [Pseudarthrobacter sulfonivorans]|uniref:Uncharacterized protein n=1 Tax=Pseudarthrobacter sulfonivorans TaxID=121292 RepID=A0A0U3Q848_9MICC|nr:hypothetical protein AU252_09770 [Pseudarthrobacter sulfonivorans]
MALPAGACPFRTRVDPANDGSEEVSDAADRISAEVLTRIGLQDLLTIRPAPVTAHCQSRSCRGSQAPP